MNYLDQVARRLLYANIYLREALHPDQACDTDFCTRMEQVFWEEWDVLDMSYSTIGRSAEEILGKTNNEYVREMLDRDEYWGKVEFCGYDITEETEVTCIAEVVYTLLARHIPEINCAVIQAEPEGWYGDVWKPATYRYFDDSPEVLKPLVEVSKEGLSEVNVIFIENTYKYGEGFQVLYRKTATDCPAVQAIMNIRDSLEGYPILNEWAFSEMEYNLYTEAFENEFEAFLGNNADALVVMDPESMTSHMWDPLTLNELEEGESDEGLKRAGKIEWIKLAASRALTDRDGYCLDTNYPEPHNIRDVLVDAGILEL